MKNQKPFDMDARDWSKFPWEVIIDGLPTPEELIDHELRNEFNGEIYLSEDRELWSEKRSEAEIGPDQLDADDIVDAYCDLFSHKENVERSRKVFEQAAEDDGLPEKTRRVVEKALNMYEGMRNYKDIIQDKHSSKDAVSYDFLLDPVVDKPYVSLNEESTEGLKKRNKKVRIGESVFFFLNTVDKNFHEYVIDEVEDPELNIDAYIEDDKLRLDIYDNGPGISEEEAIGVFDLDTGGGTGLPTANYIIEEYGGGLELYRSERGFGLTARFELEDF